MNQQTARSVNRAAEDFAIAGGKTYLNCAYQGPLPEPAARAVGRALERERSPYLIQDTDYFDVPDGYRRAAASIIGARPADVAVTNSATDGIMLVVNGLDWRPGDEVVLPAGEFPANRFPWLSLEARGVVVREVELPPGEDDLGRLEAAMGARTRVLSTSWVSYRNGYRRDLESLSRLCRDRGVLLVVDGSQGIGGLPFDLSTVRCDVLTCAGYKWLLGPYGTGFAWVRPELADRLALGNVNWFSIEGARDFNRLSQCRLEHVPGAIRFDVNETASFLTLEAATASLEYLHGITVEAVAGHVRALLDRILERLPAGFRPVSDLAPAHRSNILCLSAESPEATQAAHRRLAEGGLVTSLREGAIRVSPHVYNTAGEIDRFIDLLGSGS